jgi:pyruvate,water dikinase
VRRVVPLEKAVDDALFGSKAVGLGQAIRDGLPVPPGVALSGAIVEAVAAGDRSAIREIAKRVTPLGGPLAVRSSAIDEDGATASFAGQHSTFRRQTSSARP